MVGAAPPGRTLAPRGSHKPVHAFPASVYPGRSRTAKTMSLSSADPSTLVTAPPAVRSFRIHGHDFTATDFGRPSATTMAALKDIEAVLTDASVQRSVKEDIVKGFNAMWDDVNQVIEYWKREHNKCKDVRVQLTEKREFLLNEMSKITAMLNELTAQDMANDARDAFYRIDELIDQLELSRS